MMVYQDTRYDATGHTYVVHTADVHLVCRTTKRFARGPSTDQKEEALGKARKMCATTFCCCRCVTCGIDSILNPNPQFDRCF